MGSVMAAWMLLRLAVPHGQLVLTYRKQDEQGGNLPMGINKVSIIVILHLYIILLFTCVLLSVGGVRKLVLSLWEVIMMIPFLV